MSSLFSKALAFLSLTAAACADDAPQIFWASDPVRPGETVVLQGAGFGTNASVRLRGPREYVPTGEVLQCSETSLKFVIPADYPEGVIDYHVSVAKEDQSFVRQHAFGKLNAPDVWWIQGSAGETSDVGGAMRVLGKNLQTVRQLSFQLESSTTSRWLNATSADCYSVTCVLPENLKSGRYKVSLHTGLRSGESQRDPPITNIEAPTSWPTNVFSVVESLGKDAEKEMRKSLVKYRDVKDHTAGILAALKKAKENGGGIVYFPAGRYGITNEIAVPPKTVLRGEGEGLVVLWWGTGRFNLDGGSNLGYERPADAAKVPQNLIFGRDFTIENMSLYVPPDYQTVIDGYENVRIRHVRARIDHFWTLHTQRYDGWFARLGKNCEVTDCDIQAKGGGISPGSYCYIARNKLTAGKTPCPMGGSRQVIVEDNEFISTHPTAYQNIAGHGKNIYYARNTHTSLNVHQADFSFTFDAGTAAYLGRIAAVNGTNLTLAADPVFDPWAKENSSLWKEAVVCILDGKGAGQYRDVTSNAGRAWTIDRPFDVASDQTSTVTIVPFNGRILVVGNRFEDANWVNAGYGTSIDVIYANNKLYRCAQLLNYGLDAKKGQVLPSWYVQYLDNEIYEGQTGIDVTGSIRNPDLYNGPITRCVIERRNSFAADNSGSISVGGHVNDVLVENNVLRHPYSFLRADGDATGVVFRNNVFESGTPRYEGSQISNAVIIAAPTDAK